MEKISIVLILSIIFIGGYSLFSYKSRTNKQSNKSVLKTTGDEDINNLIENLKKSMEEYMKIADPPYSKKDIEQCLSLLSDYAINIFKTHSKEEAMLVVESTVLKLNELNESCDFSLIETSEREQIAEIIILASNKMGYNSIDEDITEEWRDW